MLYTHFKHPFVFLTLDVFRFFKLTWTQSYLIFRHVIETFSLFFRLRLLFTNNCSVVHLTPFQGGRKNVRGDLRFGCRLQLSKLFFLAIPLTEKYTDSAMIQLWRQDWWVVKFLCFSMWTENYDAIERSQQLPISRLLCSFICWFSHFDLCLRILWNHHRGFWFSWNSDDRQIILSIWFILEGHRGNKTSPSIYGNRLHFHQPRLQLITSPT